MKKSVLLIAAVLWLILGAFSIQAALADDPGRDVVPTTGREPVTQGVSNSQAPAEVLVPVNESVIAQAKTPVSVLVREDCGHCKDEKAFLEKLSQERDDFQIIYVDIYTPEGAALFDAITALEGLSKSTPVTLVGNGIIQGFATGDTTGKRIIDLLDASAGKETMTFEEYLAAGGSSGDVERVDGGVCDEEGCVLPEDELLVSIPFMGPVDVKKYSLPVMAMILGLIDGFNPCAMWVLVTFLIVLLQIGNRRKMLEIAGLFIIAEAIMYYLILNVWFTTWDFVGLDHIVTPIVGLIAIGGGLFFLYECVTSDGTCQVTNLEQRAKISSKIKDLASKPLTLMTAAGVIALAFSVNVIEFACSIGIPQAFTKIVELNGLNVLQTQGLMFLYILFYMVDDVIVFGLAFWGAEKLHLTAKYSRISNGVGGALMIILGLLLIFAPNVLRF